MMTSSMKLCLCLVIIANLVGTYSSETESSIVNSEKTRNGNKSVSATQDTGKRRDFATGTGEKHPLMREVYSDVKSVLKYLPAVSANLSEAGRSLGEMKRFALGFMDDIKVIREEVAKIKKKTNAIYQNVTGHKKEVSKVVNKAVKSLTKMTNSSFEDLEKLYSTIRDDYGDVSDNYNNVANNITKMHRQVNVLAEMWPTIERWINSTVHHFVDLGSNQEQIKHEIQQCKLSTTEGLNRLDNRLEIAFTGLNEDTKLIHERVVSDIMKVTSQISDLKDLISTTCQQTSGRLYNRKLRPRFSPLDLLKYWPWIERFIQMYELIKEKQPMVGIGGSIGVGHLLNAPDILKNLTGLFGGVAGVMMFPDFDFDIPWHLLPDNPIPIGTPRPATPEPQNQETSSAGFWNWQLPSLPSFWDLLVAPDDVDDDELQEIPDYYYNNEIAEGVPVSPNGPEVPPVIPGLPDWIPEIPITLPPIFPEVTVPPIIPTLPPIPDIFPEPSIPPIPELLPPAPSIPDIYPTKPEVTTQKPTLPPSVQYTLLEPAVPFESEPLKGYCPCVCPCDCTCPIVPIESRQKTSTWWMQFHHFNRQIKTKACECLCACPCPSPVTTTEKPLPVGSDYLKPTRPPRPIDDAHAYYDQLPFNPSWDLHSDEEMRSDESGGCVELSNRVLREVRVLKQDFNVLKMTVRDEMVVTREAILGQMNAKFAEVTNALAGIHQANVILHATDKNATDTVNHVVKGESAKTLYTLRNVSGNLRQMNSAVNTMLKTYYKELLELSRNPYDLYWPNGQKEGGQTLINRRATPASKSKKWFFGREFQKK